MPKFRITVEEVTQREYEVEAADEDAAWKLDPVDFTDAQLLDDLGGDIHIENVQRMSQ